MRLDRVVCVELGEDAEAIRIFRNEKAAHASGATFTKMYYRVAVGQVRRKVWLRCKGECELCGSIVVEVGGHMHEQFHRGRGGEISLENSLFICAICHSRAHSDREVKFTRRTI